MPIEMHLCLSETLQDRVSFDFEAAILFALSDGRRQIYGFDHTPPPFRQKLLTFLADRGETFESEDYVRFTITSPKTIIGLLSLINWVDTVVFILDQKPFAQLGTPVFQRRWLVVRDPFAWFTDHVIEWQMICFVGTSPYRGVDIRSEHLSYSELYGLVAPVILTYGLDIHKAELKLCKHSQQV